MGILNIFTIPIFFTFQTMFIEALNDQIHQVFILKNQ